MELKAVEFLAIYRYEAVNFANSFQYFYNLSSAVNMRH